MGYRVKPVRRIHSKAQFKVTFEVFKDGVRSETSIPKPQWSSLGFHEDMSVDDARARRDQLNASLSLKKIEESRVRINQRVNQETLEQSVFLPLPLIQEFELKLFGRLKTTKKLKTHWAVTKRILFNMKLDPSQWSDAQEQFYDYFSLKQYSISYLTTLIPLLNKWGLFVSKKQGKFFDPLKIPKGIERERIADANLDKTVRTGNKASLPITPELLEKRRSSLTFENYNWLFLSVWLGLRPIEVDLLLQESGSPRTWSEVVVKEIKVLRVYQSKIVRIPRDKRIKSIPILTPQHEVCLQIVHSKAFKRPLAKTIVSNFGEGYTLYGGRKGFVSLMLSLGYTLEKISRWMGHSDITRTWTSYTDKNEDLV